MNNPFIIHNSELVWNCFVISVINRAQPVMDREKMCQGEAAAQGCRAESEFAQQARNFSKHKFQKLTTTIYEIFYSCRF